MNALDTLPPEVILHILSYLDLPELDALARVSPSLAILTQDPVLHHLRLFVIAPSRVEHALFGFGGTLRPTVADLVHWGFMRGLGLERRWRMGLYLHSPQSIKQFETSQRLQRTRVERLLSLHIQRTRAALASQAAALQSLHRAGVLPDEEGSSPAVARSLLPIMRKLKWSIQRDALARKVRARDGEGEGNTLVLKGSASALLLWLEGRGRGLWKEHERFRLAICPSIAKNIRFFESLGK